VITYSEALEYIYDLTKYGIKLGLKNINYLLYLLGEFMLPGQMERDQPVPQLVQFFNLMVIKLVYILLLT